MVVSRHSRVTERCWVGTGPLSKVVAEFRKFPHSPDDVTAIVNRKLSSSPGDWTTTRDFHTY